MAELLQRGVNVNQATRFSSDTALHVAVYYAQRRAVKLLLEHPGITPNLPCREGGTALHLAAKGGDVLIVGLLLRFPAVEVNAQWPDVLRGFTPLMVAVQQKENGATLAIVDQMLRHKGIEVNRQNLFGFTALHLAVCGGRIDIVRRLLEHPETDVHILVPPQVQSPCPSYFATSPLVNPACTSSMYTASAYLHLTRFFNMHLFASQPDLITTPGALGHDRPASALDLAATTGNGAIESLLRAVGTDKKPTQKPRATATAITSIAAHDTGSTGLSAPCSLR